VAQSNVLSGLVTKRSELAGQIKTLERELKELAGHVKTLDGAIKIIDPGFNLNSIRAKRTNSKNLFFRERGEASKFVLDSLREASEPLSTNELAELARDRKGLRAPDMRALRACILTTLSRQRIKGVVVEVGRNETGAIEWELAR
jgi:hypothetical protein